MRFQPRIVTLIWFEEVNECAASCRSFTTIAYVMHTYWLPSYQPVNNFFFSLSVKIILSNEKNANKFAFN